VRILSVQVSYKKQFVLGIMLISVLLVACEGVLRVYDYQNPNCLFENSNVFANLDNDLKRSICLDNDNLRWSYEPYLQPNPNQHFSTININQDGFRGKEISLEKPSDTLRVFVVGGSTVFGVGSTSDLTTIPGYLQKQYDYNSNLNIEVVNAGTPKAYSFSNAERIKNNLINYEPDLFIVYTGWNDLGKTTQDRYFDVSEESTIMSSFLEFLMKNEYYKSFGIIYKNYQIWRISTVDNVTIEKYDYSEKHSNEWKNSWDEICELGQKNNFDVIITLQPILGTGSKQLTDEEIRNYEFYNQESKLKPYGDFASVLPELNIKCTKVKDLRNIFENNNETVFFDGGHTGDFGNGIIAKELFELSLPILEETYHSAERSQ
tara:strand:+ start:3461 stop:4588 length:1128 start_codon:yes stop_codon:yes gene_type:complete